MAIKHPGRKGDRLEEEVASIIRKNWKLPDEDSAERSARSGNYRTEIGDIKFNIGMYIPILVECRNREQWKYANIFEFTGNVKIWWDKDCYAEMEELQKKTGKVHLALLILTRKYQKRFVIFNTQNVKDFLKENAEFSFDFDEFYSDAYFCIKLGNGFFVMYADDFFNVLTFDRYNKN